MPAYPDDGAPPPDEANDDEAVSAQRRTQRSGESPSPSGSAPAQPVHRPGSLIDTERYTEHDEIGRGASGVVIRAYDNDILRFVAVKIFNPELAADDSQIDRFAEEARITGQLEHPNIVPVYELGRDRAGRRFLAMKLVEGVTLEKTLIDLADARLDPAHLGDILQVFVKVCDAVSFAHSRRVIHRDLKPTNIMISDFGQVYVLDWGIARLRPPSVDQEGPRLRVRTGQDTAEHSELDPPGSLIGTPCYMAPEQLHGLHDQLDERADVFAIGATLYQVLTGQPPLTPEIVRAIWTRKTPPPVVSPDHLDSGGRVPPELARIAMRAMAYDRADRYRSVADLKRDIESFQRGAWDLPRVRLAAGSVVVAEGEAGDAAYVILEGRCAAYRMDGSTEVQLRVMGPGDVFGETAVFSHKPRTASVKAMNEVVLLRVTGEVLSRALGLNSWMGAFVRALAERFREADQRLRTHDRVSPVPPELAPISSRTAYGDAGTPPTDGARLPGDLDSLRQAATGLPRSSLPAGTVIVSPGDSDDAGYLIMQGRCVEYRIEAGTEATLREMASGDVFGELAVLSGRPSRVGVKAVTDVELAVVSRDVLASALGLNSWMGAFVKALADRFGELDDTVRGPTRR